jgi:hypothetical protein
VTEYFRGLGHTVTRMCRPDSDIPSHERVVQWDARSGDIHTPNLAGQDVIINLAGANIAAQKWSAWYKEEILNSRVHGTRLLCQVLAKFKLPPKVLLSASAVGFYGIHPSSDCMDESGPAGSDFLSGVCDQWEQATQPAVEAGIRVVHMRFGVVLSGQGGALSKMLKPFQYGLGGKIGPGDQMMSWIALDEIPHVMKHLIESESISGAVNVVSPQPVTNAQFTRTLGKVLRRPTILPLPSFAVKLLFGEMGETLLLGGQKVIPAKLIESGYHFKYSALEEALSVSLAPKRSAQ